MIRALRHLPNVIRKESSARAFLGSTEARVLNLGAGNQRIASNSVNLDIQDGKDVDVRGDAHALPFKEESFDIVIAVAMLQYCKRPHDVIEECARVLVKGGTIYVDAPFVQPYCRDTPDRFRFTKDGLIGLFEPFFKVRACEPSIAGPSALAFYVQSSLGVTRNKYVNHAINWAVSLLVWPLKFVPPFTAHTHAGAFYLIGEKVQRTMSHS